MADITTQTIRDTFLDNLPENVTREEGEEFWNAWLDRQREGHEPDMPTPPVGFQYAPGEVDEFDYGEPDLEDEQLTEDQKRDMLGLVHDYAMNTSELARTMLDCQHFDDPQVRELVRQTFKDLECAGSHVSDALKLMGLDCGRCDGWLKFLPLPSMPGHVATEENRLFSIKNRLITNPEVTVGTV